MYGGFFLFFWDFFSILASGILDFLLLHPKCNAMGGDLLLNCSLYFLNYPRSNESNSAAKYKWSCKHTTCPHTPCLLSTAGKVHISSIPSVRSHPNRCITAFLWRFYLPTSRLPFPSPKVVPLQHFCCRNLGIFICIGKQ